MLIKDSYYHHYYYGGYYIFLYKTYYLLGDLMFKYWVISLIYFISIFFCSSLIMTILYYFNFIGDKVVFILKIIIPVISIAVSGYIMGRHSREKGYLSGIKIGSSIISIFLVLVLLFDKINIKTILYYVILMLIAILGSMIGINLQKK